MGEFPCRTKTISGVDYIIKCYSASDNSLRSSCSGGFTEESANAHVNRMKEKLGDKYRWEIVTHSWTKEVCIECGKEDW